MANRIKIRHGTLAPQPGDLERYELGIFNDNGTYKLYCGGLSGEAPAWLNPPSSSSVGYEDLTTKPAINGHILALTNSLATLGIAASDHTHTTISNALQVNGNLIVSNSGTLTVPGATTLNSTLSVDGNTTIGGNLTANGDATINGTATFTGSLLVRNSGALSDLRTSIDFQTAENYLGLRLSREVSDGRMIIFERSLASGGGYATGYDKYKLPAPDFDLSSNKEYDILTSKDYPKLLFKGSLAKGGTTPSLLGDITKYKVFAVFTNIANTGAMIGMRGFSQDGLDGSTIRFYGTVIGSTSHAYFTSGLLTITNDGKITYTNLYMFDRTTGSTPSGEVTAVWGLM